MPQFRYRALNSQGHELEGTLTATDANAAVTQLSRQGLRLRSIEEGVTVARVPAYQPAVSTPVQISVPQQRVPQPVAGKGPRYGVKPSPRATYNDRQFFFAQLGGLLRSGISPADALNTILSRSSSGKFQRQVDDMAKMCSEGMGLAEAMEHYPNMFPKGTVGAVRAGETGGYLPDACETVSQQQKETRRVFFFFMGFAIILPFFIGGVLLAVSIAAGINRGIDAIRDGVEGPAVQTGFMDSFYAVSGPLLLVIAAAFAAAYFVGRGVRFRHARHKLGLSMPPFKGRAVNENLAHFSYHLGQLAKSGLSPFASWRLAAQAVPNEAYSVKMIEIGEHLNERSRLSEMLYKSRLFPRETAQLVETGEITGDLPKALDQVMEFGREKEKQALVYIGFKAGCWTLLLFTAGGMVVFMIVYATYLRGVFRVLD